MSSAENQALELAEALCKRFEGFRSKPYICPAGHATIGYGSTYYADGRKVTMQDTAISELEARVLLNHELLVTYAPGVYRCCPGLAFGDPAKLAAIVDFAYNLGVGRLQASTLRRRINQGNWSEAIYELRKWVMGGGKKLPGLVIRREAEIELIKRETWLD